MKYTTGLQWLAMLTMLADHIGAVFFPDDLAWRMVGRIAFPIYAYGIARGLDVTRDRRAYLKRLAVLAAISQIPYMLALDALKFNVIFSFFLIAWVFVQSERLQGKSGKVLAVLAAAFILEMFRFDYGAYGLLLILIYRHAAGWKVIAYHAILNIAAVAFYGPVWLIQQISILPTIIMSWKKENSRIMRPPVWLWRSFYPAHLSIIIVFRLIF